MSTVSVTYGLKALKVSVTASTPVSEILDKATKHFKLDSATTGLFHNNTQLSPGLPYRLLNLPAGAKLSLKQSKAKESSEITVKVQFINSSFSPSSTVHKFKSQQTLRSAVEDLEQKLGIEVFGKGYVLKFQSLARSVGEDEIDSLTLAHFGVENNGILRVSISRPTAIKGAASKKPDVKKAEEHKDVKPTAEQTSNVPLVTITPNQKTEEHQEIVDQDNDNLMRDDNSSPGRTLLGPEEELGTVKNEEVTSQLQESSPETPKEIPQHVYVFKPTDEPLPRPNTDDEVYEVTVSHARAYQDLLSRAAHETNKAKRLRQEAQKRSVTNIEIRIKYPDNTTVQVNFKPNDTNDQLYSFVRGTLLDESEDFTLSIPYPSKKLDNDVVPLVTNLESRNLLLFNSGRKTGRFLKDEYMAKALSLRDAEEVKLDLTRNLIKEDDEAAVKDDNKHGGVVPKKKELGEKKKDNDGRKIPKWLKLGKS